MNILGAFNGYSSNNINESREFYRDTLGVKAEDSMGGLDIAINGQKVFIYPKEDHVPAAFTVLNFVVDDINQAVDELVQKGVEFLRYDNMPAPQDERGVLRGKDANMGPNIAWFNDPAGNILALVEE